MTEVFLGAGDTTLIGGLEIISETKSPISGIGMEKVECKPNFFQTLIALLRLRLVRLIRDLQKLYFMVLLPLAVAAVGLYFQTIQIQESRIQSISLSMDLYKNAAVAIHNESSQNLDILYDQFLSMGVSKLDEYDGNFSRLLDIAPHIAAFNINSFEYPNYSITILYNDTQQHSLPVVINLVSNAFYR